MVTVRLTNRQQVPSIFLYLLSLHYLLSFISPDYRYSFSNITFSFSIYRYIESTKSSLTQHKHHQGKHNGVILSPVHCFMKQMQLRHPSRCSDDVTWTFLPFLVVFIPSWLTCRHCYFIYVDLFNLYLL